MRLHDKVAIITGSGNGIGKETALLFAKEGAKLVIVDYDEASAKKTSDEINQSGGSSIYFKADVSVSSDVNTFVEETIKEYGKIDILINNAGITRDGFLVKLHEEEWQQVINVNLTGVFNCTQAVAKKMVEQGNGKIINTSSVVGVYGNIGQTNYSATKAGVIGMTKTWAKELGRKGINVNVVAPGFIITDMTKKVPDKVLDLMKDKTPIGRLGVPEDIANAYLFLASKDADYINGTVLNVDGGLVL